MTAVMSRLRMGAAIGMLTAPTRLSTAYVVTLDASAVSYPAQVTLTFTA